jgi:hypothetical protein
MGSRRVASSLSLLAALLMPAAPAAARERFAPVRPPGTTEVVITGDDVCPQGATDDLLVCGMHAMGPRQLRALQIFSQCVARRRPGAARDLLANGYDDSSRPALRRIAAWGNGCGPVGNLHVSGLLFAGAMAEAMVEMRTRRTPLERLVAVDPARPAIPARDEAEMMSFCVVGTAPAKVSALLATDGGTPADEAAVRTLFPHLTDCLGRDIRLVTNRPALRALLALAALRLALNNEAKPGEEHIGESR